MNAEIVFLESKKTIQRLNDPIKPCKSSKKPLKVKKSCKRGFPEPNDGLKVLPAVKEGRLIMEKRFSAEDKSGVLNYLFCRSKDVRGLICNAEDNAGTRAEVGQAEYGCSIKSQSRGFDLGSETKLA